MPLFGSKIIHLVKIYTICIYHSLDFYKPRYTLLLNIDCANAAADSNAQLVC